MFGIHWQRLGKGKLGIARSPLGHDALECAVPMWGEAGVEQVVTCLTPEEVEGVGLQKEPVVCFEYGLTHSRLEFTSQCLPPTEGRQLRLLRTLATAVSGGRRVLLHSRGGDRAALIATALLVLAGRTPQAACADVSATHGRRVPKYLLQLPWLHRLKLKAAAQAKKPKKGSFAAATAVTQTVKESSPARHAAAPAKVGFPAPAF